MTMLFVISASSCNSFTRPPRRASASCAPGKNGGSTSTESKRDEEVSCGSSDGSGRRGTSGRCQRSTSRESLDISAAPKRGFLEALAALAASFCLAANAVSAESRTISLGPPELGVTFDASGLPEPGSRLSDTYAQANGWQALVRDMVAGRTEAEGEILGLGGIFFEIDADSAGPFNGLRLYVDRLAVGSGQSGQTLSNLAATGIMLGARPNSQFSAGLGDANENAVVLSADRIEVFDSNLAKGEAASENVAGVSFAVANLTLDSAFGNALCGENLDLTGRAFSADLSARAQFQPNGFQINSDMMLRRDGRPDIALRAQLDVKAGADGSSGSHANEASGNATVEDSRSRTADEVVESSNGSTEHEMAPFGDSGCVDGLISSALYAVDKILATGTEVWFSVRGKRSPTRRDAVSSLPKQANKNDDSSSSEPPADASGIRTDEASSSTDDSSSTKQDSAPQGTGIQGFRLDRRNEILQFAAIYPSFTLFGNSAA